MAIFVTGGAGFIGSNFVLDWLAQCYEPLVNLDKLTFAGNLENLASLQGDALHVFVQGELGDRGLVDALLAQHRPRAVFTSPPKATWIGPSTARKTSSRLTASAPFACSKPCAPSSPPTTPKARRSQRPRCMPDA